MIIITGYKYLADCQAYYPRLRRGMSPFFISKIEATTPANIFALSTHTLQKF